MINDRNGNLLLQFSNCSEALEAKNTLVDGNEGTKIVSNIFSTEFSRWSFRKPSYDESRRALKPYVKSLALLAVKVEQSNISVRKDSKGNMCLQNIDVYTVDPNYPRLFHSTKLRHIWVESNWVCKAITRKNSAHGCKAPLYLAATAYEYEDDYSNVKYGLRTPHYCVKVDLNQYKIMYVVT